MIFKSGDKEIEIYFLKDYHLDLLTSKHISLSQLPYLPKIKEVTDDDCLDWLAFQRGVEKLYQNFSNTTYDNSGDILHSDFNRTGVLYKAKYDKLLNTDHSVDLGKSFYYAGVENKLFILSTNNTVREGIFKPLPGELRFSIYQALLLNYSLFEIYFRDNSDLNKSSKKRNFINLGFVISKILS